MLATVLPEATEKRPSLPSLPLIPLGFAWTDEEKQKLAALARMLNCTVPTAASLLVFFLRHIQDNARGLAVAQLPEVLAGFPVKWGYKKKRNDFLKLLMELDFIYVKVNYWAKIRAKKYALGKSGQDLLARMQVPVVSPSPQLGDGMM